MPISYSPTQNCLKRTECKQKLQTYNHLGEAVTYLLGLDNSDFADDDEHVFVFPEDNKVTELSTSTNAQHSEEQEVLLDT